MHELWFKVVFQLKHVGDLVNMPWSSSVTYSFLINKGQENESDGNKL